MEVRYVVKGGMKQTYLTTREGRPDAVGEADEVIDADETDNARAERREQVAVKCAQGRDTCVSRRLTPTARCCLPHPVAACDYGKARRARDEPEQDAYKPTRADAATGATLFQTACPHFVGDVQRLVEAGEAGEAGAFLTAYQACNSGPPELQVESRSDCGLAELHRRRDGVGPDAAGRHRPHCRREPLGQRRRVSVFSDASRGVEEPVIQLDDVTQIRVGGAEAS